MASMETLKSYRMSYQELSRHGYLSLNHAKTKATFFWKSQEKKNWARTDNPKRKCARCKTNFKLNENGEVPEGRCCYHDRKRYNEKTKRKELICCDGKKKEGCQVANSHVISQATKATLSEFLATPKPNGPDDYRSNQAYALDTELVSTQNGLEVARVSLVDMNKKVVMDTHVLPKFPVIDYNTKWSGIVEKDLEDAITLDECHDQLFEFINSKTILIGHSLECDLKALRLVHSSIVDTAVIFAKKNGPKSKHPITKVSLRTLSEQLLGRQIQTGASGHCSIEDASTCIDLLATLKPRAPRPRVPEQKRIAPDVSNGSSGSIAHQQASAEQSDLTRVFKYCIILLFLAIIVKIWSL